MYYESTNRNIIEGNMMKVSLIITKRNFGAIDSDNSSRHGYYIIRFSSSLYTLHLDLNINGQVISSGEMVFERTYYFLIKFNYYYYVYPKMNKITRLYL